MGARQSVQESMADRSRTQSTATVSSNGAQTQFAHHQTGNAGTATGSNASQSRPSAGSRQSRSLSMPSSRRVGDIAQSTGGGGGGDSSDSSGDERDINRLLNALSFERWLRLAPPSGAHTQFGPSTSTANGAGGTGGGAGGPSAAQLLLAQAGLTRKHLTLFPFFDIKCPVCNKTVPSDEAETHLVMCLTRPRLTYNDKIEPFTEDTLTEDKGECIICFDDMLSGELIARLPCLCIYHKTCIDSWFKVKNICPEHPGDD